MKITLKDNKSVNEIVIGKDIFFNCILLNNKTLIKKLIKKLNPTYKISKSFFTILNEFIDYEKNGNYKYPGLIVRTNLYNYTVLYLEGTLIDEEYMLSIITEYILDVNDYKPEEINVDLVEITEKEFISAYKNIL